MNRKTKAIAIVAILGLLMSASAVLAARSEEAAAAEDPGIGGQFLDSFLCIFTRCGWPAIIIFILPPIAIWFYKKFFSLG